MWQEMTVGLLVAAAALFLGIRLRRNVTAARTGKSACDCQCSECGQDSNATSCSAGDTEKDKSKTAG
jgi:hypothetical protein